MVSSLDFINFTLVFFLAKSLCFPQQSHNFPSPKMIEDTIYRTSSQYRVWSYTEESLQSLRASTNTIASDRVRVTLRRTRDAPQSATGTPQPGSDVDSKEEKPIDCLTPEEELVFVRYYCESLLELGDEYKPPLPTTLRVSEFYGNIIALKKERKKERKSADNFTYSLQGHRNSISSSFLSDQLANDLSSKKDHGLRPLPCHKNRQLLYVSTKVF